jgi:peptide/nickel transport system substrate-binding protein
MHDEKGERLPRLHGETLQIVPDGNAQYLRFLAGQIDTYAPRPEEVGDLSDKQKQLGITLKEIGIDTGSLFFAFNRNLNHYTHNGVVEPKYRWFTDIRFMRAIAHAVDKHGMINLCFHGLAAPAVSDISPANKVFYNPKLKEYDYNLKEAGDLLEQAGYHLVNGVRFDSQGQRLEFNLATNSGVNVRDQMCVIFQQDLLKLGIKVNYRPLEFTTLVDKLDSSYDWDVVLIGFSGGIEPNNGADFLRSSGALHLWNPKQPKPATPWEAEIDRLLEQGTMVMDPLKRAPYYWRIQEILHDELPIIETVRQRRYEAWKNSLENFQPTVWGTYKPEWIEFRAN